MYDPTLHTKTLARQIRKSDFEPGPLQIQIAQKAVVLDTAVLIAANGFQSVALRKANVAGRDVFQQSSLPEALITRHISENIRRVTKVKQSDRQSIVRCIRSLLAEGTAFNILKLDIRSFYESINIDDIVESLSNDPAFSRQSIALLSSLFDAFRQQGIVGLPRGLELSATLAEYALRDFDRSTSLKQGVRFYSRYVDDIFIMLEPTKDVDDLIYELKQMLPNGLEFRRSKTKICRFSRLITKSPQNEDDFSFLGYNIKVSKIFRVENALRREVSLDIAAGKVKKIKRRIALALLDFNAGGSYADLHDRIKVLTSNYEFFDGQTGARRLAGLRYNYSLINAKKSRSLTSLDHYLYNALFSRNPKNRLRPQLTVPQRRQLWGYSFKSGFRDNRFFAYNQNRLHQITRCWSHA